MSLTVVGSIAFDSVRTPFGERERMLGGSAVHFALAASFFTEVRVVGPVGDDFGDEHLEVLAERGIDTSDIERVAGGETFFWRGHYDHDMNVAHTDDTQLNVFADFEPKLSAASCEAQMLFLGNIQPDLQRQVRGQSSASFAGARLDEPVDRDRARLAGRGDRRGRLPAAQRRRAADADRGAEPGPRGAGDDGAWARAWSSPSAASTAPSLFTDDGSSRSRACRSRTSATRPAPATASPAASSATSTRSGSAGEHDDRALRRAMAYGSVMASFNVEDFGTERGRRARARPRSPSAWRRSSA